MTSPARQHASRRLWWRRILMTLGVVGVSAALGWSYVTSGRFISTDNAYIKANKILLAPDVTGPVVAVNVVENQAVKKGDELFRIDPHPYQIQFEKAQADLAAAVISINKLKSLYRQRVAERDRAQVEADFAERELTRQANLIARGSASQSQRDDAALRLAKARQHVIMLEHEVAETLSALDNDPAIPVQRHPLYLAARAEQEKARISLTRTTILAPEDGFVGTPPAVGDYARASLPLLNFVSGGPVWIEANFKETELTAVRPGQPVTITVDTYPGQVWTGKVVSISPATGSEFSLLPAQNSTGNWVKVVQRIATRISVEAGPQDLPLRTGMSTEVEIDTGHYPHLPTRKS